MSILDVPVFSRVRRNHGLEHATITILSQRFPYWPFSGYSTPGGFFILGDVPTADLREAVVQALVRLNNGERHLAVHEHCGTNYVTSGFVAGGLAWLSMAGARTRRSQVERLPLALALAVMGLIVSQPLGPAIQARVTTSGDPQGLSIVDVFPLRFGRLTLHRVVTQN
jgi:hypothetical protein